TQTTGKSLKRPCGTSRRSIPARRLRSGAHCSFEHCPDRALSCGYTAISRCALAFDKDDDRFHFSCRTATCGGKSDFQCGDSDPESQRVSGGGGWVICFSCCDLQTLIFFLRAFYWRSDKSPRLGIVACYAGHGSGVWPARSRRGTHLLRIRERRAGRSSTGLG